MTISYLHDTSSDQTNIKAYLEAVQDVLILNLFGGSETSKKHRPCAFAKKSGVTNENAKTDRFCEIYKKKNDNGSYCLNASDFYADKSWVGDLPDPATYSLTTAVSIDSTWNVFDESALSWDLAFDTSRNAGASQWDNQNGTSDHASITGNVAVVSNELNGHSVYRFTGGYMTASKSISTDSETYIIVCKWNSFLGSFYTSLFGGTSGSYFFGCPSTSNVESGQYWQVTGAGISQRLVSLITSKFNLDRWVTLRIRRGNDRLEVFENGVLIAYSHFTDSVVSIAGGLWIGKNYNNHTLKGDIAAFYRKDAYMSDNECEAQEEYLRKTFQHYNTPRGLESYSGGARRYFYKNGFKSLSQLPTPQPLHALAGQSNAEGQDNPYVSDLPAELKLPIQNGYIWYNNEFQTLQAGVNSKAISSSFHGSEITFANTISQARGVCYMVKYTVGGTSLENQWNPSLPFSVYPDNGYLYHGLKLHIEQCIFMAGDTTGLSLELKYINWYQGEYDCEPLSRAQAYQAREEAFKAGIGADNDPYYTFIITQVVWNNSLEGYDELRAAKVAHAAADERVFLIDNWTEKTSSGHINSEEQQAVGNLSAAIVLNN